MAKPRPTEEQLRTALAAQCFADYLDSVPIAVIPADLPFGPTETAGIRDQERADGHLAKMRQLLEQNAADEPQA